MLTAENFRANLVTAARNAAAAAGVTGIASADFTLAQRQAYNRELIRVIIAYPNSFSAESVNMAATMNTDYGLRGHYFDSAFDTAWSSVTETASALYDKTTKLAALVAVILGLFFVLKYMPARRE